MDNFSEPKNAVIYARYSSHSQRDVSIEQQIKACKLFAERQGLEILRIYDDRATTGTNDRRPGFQQMIKDAEKKEWQYVIIYTLDRFARDRYDSAVYKRRLKECGVKVLSAMENISDDPTGVLMESLLEGLAEYYSKELSRKIRRGMEDNASKCLCNGQIPFGYRRGEDGRFAIDEAEAPIVQEIYRRIRDGSRLCDIVYDMNERGIRTKKGKPWSKSSFNTLLSNERYTGVYIYKDVRIPGGMPQIIEPALFDAVQLIMHTKKNPRKNSAPAAAPQRRRQENGIYYLTGKLFCGHCHSPMVGVSGRSKNGPLYYYYTCKGKRTDRSCDKKNANRDFIEMFIATALKETMLNDKAICALADAAVKYQQQRAPSAEIESLQTRSAEIKKSIKNIIAAIEAGAFSAAMQTRLAELETEQKTVLTQLSLLQEETEDALTREEIIAMLRLMRNGDICEESFREALIDTFLVAAYLYDDHVKIVFNLGGQKENAVLPFDIEDVDLSDTSIKGCKLHQTLLYEHFGITVIMIGGLFVFQKMLKDIR
jgi:DNA invertase Pin-like site-specific DNA recombinase